jgi:hypothetical protein
MHEENKHGSEDQPEVIRGTENSSTFDKRFWLQLGLLAVIAAGLNFFLWNMSTKKNEAAIAQLTAEITEMKATAVRGFAKIEELDPRGIPVSKKRQSSRSNPPQSNHSEN